MKNQVKLHNLISICYLFEINPEKTQTQTSISIHFTTFNVTNKGESLKNADVCQYFFRTLHDVGIYNLQLE
jgi:hypothetical protein